MRDVSARHIAGNQNCVDIVWADGGMEHRSAAAGTNDTKITGPSGETITYANENDDRSKPCESNPDPFFSLHIFDRGSTVQGNLAARADAVLGPSVKVVGSQLSGPQMSRSKFSRSQTSRVG
jgi:hypothetical protein